MTADELWRGLRKRGKTLPATDCIIAQLCLSRNLSLFSFDAHFDDVEGLNRVRLPPAP